MPDWTFPLPTDSQGNQLDTQIGWGSEYHGFRDSAGNAYDYQELKGSDGLLHAGWIPVSDKKKNNWLTILIIAILIIGVGYYLIKKSK